METAMSNPSPCYAAIDLGSNSCRLLIGEKNGITFHTIDAYSRVTRLSEGVATTGYITQDAQTRTLLTLKQALRRLENYKPHSIRCVATEVCRRAKNAPDFLKKVREETGLDFSVISEEQEASLAVLGLTPLLNPAFPYAIIFDVGGASSEIVLVKNLGPNIQPEILDWISIPMGVVSVLETHNPEHCKNYFAIVEYIKEKLIRFGEAHDINTLISEQKVQLIGASGTATTAASIHLGLRYYDRDRIDGLEMSFDDVDSVIKKLQMMSITERSMHPCIGVERADLVLGGMAIFEGLSSAWPVGHITVADRGVRDGIMTQMILTTPETMTSHVA